MAVTTNAAVVAKGWLGATAALKPQLDALVAKHARSCQARAQANASGRSGLIYSPDANDLASPPGEVGPRTQTGDFRRSISAQQVAPGAWRVGSAAPQARRLELGFIGEDALGRVYHQSPLPWLRPAFHAERPPFLNAMHALWIGYTREVAKAA